MAEHDVVVELQAKTLVQTQRVVEEIAAFRIEIVGANSGRVSTGVAATKPAFLKHGHVRDPVLLGEVVRGRQTLTTAAYDHNVIAFFRRRVAPGRCPAFVVRKRVLGKRPERVFFHAYYLAYRITVRLPFMNTRPSACIRTALERAVDSVS
ncbi:hypothetical protein D3C80_1297330 [compost metagenome]